MNMKGKTGKSIVSIQHSNIHGS